MRCGYWPCGWCKYQRDCVRRRESRRANRWAALVLLGLSGALWLLLWVMKGRG